jgi:hypothetical protein
MAVHDLATTIAGRVAASSPSAPDETKLAAKSESAAVAR